MGFIKRLFGKTDPKQNSTPDKSVIHLVPKVEVILTEDQEKRIIEHLVKTNAANEDILDHDDIDSVFEEAARLIVEIQIGSTALLQRRLKLGYNRAERLMDQLEAAGIVGDRQGSKARDVLIKSESELQSRLNSITHFFKIDGIVIDLDKFKKKHAEEITSRITEYEIESKEQEDRKEKEQIKIGLLEKNRKKQLQREVLKELIDSGEISIQFTNKEGKREPIPQDVMDQVWNRDGGKCVNCGSVENLEFDHIIPFSKGGATSYRNLQLLCKQCNISKSNRIG